MGIIAKFHGSCYFEIRRLLVIISLVVALMVVLQCLTKSLFLSVTDEGFITMMVGNTSVTYNNASSKVHVAVTSDREEKESVVGQDLEVSAEHFRDYSFYKSKDGDMFKNGVPHDESLKMGYAASAINSSIETKATGIGRGHLENVGKLQSKYKSDGDKNVTNSLTLSGLYRTTNLSSCDNVEQNESKPANAKASKPPSRTLTNNITGADISILKKWNRRPTSITEMDLLLLRSRVASRSLRLWSSSVRGHELLSARVEIENAPVAWKTPGLQASVFRNVSMFKSRERIFSVRELPLMDQSKAFDSVIRRSYELMESILKVYIYKEGEKPIFHQPIMRGIYASEGWFMKLIEGNRKFVVRDPRKANLFYLPFSSQMLRIALSNQQLQSQKDLQNYLKNYVDVISRKYRFWNSTGGADHFVVACHDWAPQFTRQHMKNSIKALCNANVRKGFKIGMDTSLPVTYVRSAEAPQDDIGGKPPLERSALAFFAGSIHGYLRPILLNYWENKFDDMKIFGPMPHDIESKRIYREHMKSTKYCICARGYQVHTPRVVEAIFYECVPVIISDNYVPPFFEVLNWEAFSVFVQEKDIPNLRNILLSIPDERYLAMQSRVKMVQKHFLWHKKPKEYDVFHMILHSIWNNRVFNTKIK